MEDCVFCEIVTGDIPAETVYQDDELIAIRDISPMAPTHLLVITKKHIASLNELLEADFSVTGDMAKIASQLAKKEGIAESGYRIVINCGKQGGQSVSHLHMHLLGGW